MIQQYILGDNGNVFDNSGNMFPYISGLFSAGMKLWLRADAGIVKDANDKVGVWRDQSGNGRDAIQGTAANQPIWVDNELNGNPVLRFNGSQWLTTGDLSSAQPFSLFFVKKINSGSNTVIINNTSNTVLIQSNNESLIMRALATNVLYPLTYPTPYFLTSAMFNTSNSGLYRNGQVESSGDAGSNSFGGGMVIGQSVNNVARLNGDIAEIIFYNSLLSDPQRQSVENYLMTKYALT